MLESRKDNYYGFDVTMYRIGDHLWISNVMPNAHYIPRSKGGLGIEQNIVTLCTEMTLNKCHRKYDFGTKKEREEIGKKIKNHLKSKYDNWNEEDLYYKKWRD